MLAFRYAFALAVFVLLVAGWLAAQAAGYRPVLVLENLSLSTEKYGLPGYTAALRLVAARLLARSAGDGSTPPTGAARVAADRAADNYFYAARLLSAQGLLREAAAVLQSALITAPWRGDVQAKLLELQVQRADPGAVRRLMDLAYRRGDPHAQAALARVYLASGRPDDAAACMTRALAALPNDYELRMTAARYLMTLGARRDAILHAEAARRVARNIAEELAALDLLQAAGAEVPARFDVLWAHCLNAYGPTVLVAVAYLLVLLSPALFARVRQARARYASEEPLF